MGSEIKRLVFVGGSHVYTERVQGESVDFDIAVLSTGVSPPTIFARSGLKTSEHDVLLSFTGSSR